MEELYGVFEGIIFKEMSKVPMIQASVLFLIGIVVLGLCMIFWQMLRKQKIPAYRVVTWFLFWAYVCFMITVTYLNRKPGTRDIITLYLQLGNPFGTKKEQVQFAYMFLNFGFFVPFGFLLSILETKEKIWKNIAGVTLYSIYGTFAIEITQLVTHSGNFEVTDLLMNTLGGMVGAIMVQSVCYARQMEREKRFTGGIYIPQHVK